MEEIDEENKQNPDENQSENDDKNEQEKEENIDQAKYFKVTVNRNLSHDETMVSETETSKKGGKKEKQI